MRPLICGHFPRLALNSRFSCLPFLSTGIPGVRHYALTALFCVDQEEKE